MGGAVKNNRAAEKVLQSLLESTSAIELAVEMVKPMLCVDDIASQVSYHTILIHLPHCTGLFLLVHAAQNLVPMTLSALLVQHMFRWRFERWVLKLGDGGEGRSAIG